MTPPALPTLSQPLLTALGPQTNTIYCETCKAKPSWRAFTQIWIDINTNQYVCEECLLKHGKIITKDIRAAETQDQTTTQLETTQNEGTLQVYNPYTFQIKTSGQDRKPKYYENEKEATEMLKVR